MPITIKSSRMQYRKSNGDYVGVDAVSERKTSEYVSAIDAKGTETLESIPNDYTALGNDVARLKSSMNFGKTVTPGYILTASNDGNGLVWSPVGLPTDEQTEEAVTSWLDEHPEATTTVEDGSLTEVKFLDALKLKTVKDYVTPEMYGAKGDGVTDDYDAIMQALATNKTVLLGYKTYYCSNTVKLLNDQQIIGANRKGSIIKFAEDINGIQLNHSNIIRNFTIVFSGDGSGLYLYTPDDYSYSLSTVAMDLTIRHNEDVVEGSFIRLVAQAVTDKPYGAYNLTFSNIDCRNAAKYGIEIINRVATNSNYECWFTELKFNSIFFDKVETAFLSDWEDISGTNAAPHTGQASINANIKLINVSSQYTAGISENYAIIRNARNVEFIGCNPFDYYHLPNTYHKPIFIFNATSSMCVVNLGWMYEFPSYSAIKANPYISFENSTDYDSDFKNIVKYLENSTGLIFGDFEPFNGIMKRDFLTTNFEPVTSQYGSCVYGYLKIGNLVIVSFCIRPSGSTTFPANTNILSGTLPAPIATYAGVSIRGYTSGNYIDALVRYNGELQLSAPITTANPLSFTGVYFS